INQVCARLGTILSHAPIRDGAAKGKIERFFRSVRDKFLLQVLDMSSLKTLNDQFRVWVEEEYNAAVHGTLQMKPVDRFAMDLKRIRFLDPMDYNEELFFFEQERCVRKDMSIRTKKGHHPDCVSRSAHLPEHPQDPLRSDEPRVRGRAEKNEQLLIEAAFKVNAKGRLLVPVIDDAHLMEAGSAEEQPAWG
ncbi:MAG: hypothetical protein PHO37_18540, partial [Kiritimatiellae bacterium]|nr:hypothetical protein [Kiritimatiellia bacterium]